MKNKLFIFINLVFILTINAQTTVKLVADYDAAIGYHDNFNTADNNYGTAVQNAAYNIPGANGGLNVNRALIHFNLSDIPSGAVITNAKLNLYALGPVGTLSGHTGEYNNSYLKRVTAKWNENTVTWNNQPSSTTHNQVILPTSIHPLQNYTNIDVTALIKDMHADANFGFLLKQISNDPTNALLFASLDCGDKSKFPTLEVTYDINCVIIRTDEDAAIGYHDNFNTAGNNYGTAIQNAAYIIPGASGGLNENKALIRFDLSAIPVGCTITSAKLNLYALGPIGTLPGHLGQNNSAVLQRVTGNWAENTVTWNNQPTSVNQNQVTLTASTNPLQDYTNINVTSLVQDMQITSNLGFMLQQVTTSPTNALLFCSSDHPDTLKHPMLEICYTRKNSSIAKEKTYECQIFPNPSTGLLMVKFDGTGQDENALIKIYSVNGVLIRSININNANTTINLKDLTTGIYIVNLVSATHSVVEKINLITN